MATPFIQICPPVIVVSAVAGVVLATIGAIRRDNGMFSLGLMLLGLPLAFSGFVLGWLIGWENVGELSESQKIGQVLLSVAGGIGLAFIVLGMIGTWSKGFFWGRGAEKR